MDSRVRQHAKVLVDYCTQPKPGETVVVNVEEGGAPLAEALVEELGRAGAHPVVVLLSGEAERGWMRAAPEPELDTVPRHLQSLYEATDVVITIEASGNTRSSADVPPDRSARRRRALKPLKDLRLRKRWCLTIHPTAGLAQEAGMSLREFEDIVYGAVLRDWVAFGKELDVLADRLRGSKVVRIVNAGSDVTLPVDGRTWVASKGFRNMPSGEVFTAPLEARVEGRVTFDIPVVVEGELVQDLRLDFEKGLVVDWSAGLGRKAVQQLFDTDAGARRLGELGIGCNRGIPKPTRNILLDEKLGGTVHMAVGSAYKECGGTNESAVHVDFITTMGLGSYLEVDGEKVQRDGRFWYER